MISSELATITGANRRLRSSFTVGAMASKGMDGSGSSHNLTCMRYPPRNEIFLACIYRNALSLNEERVATLHDKHVFVIIVHMLAGNCVFSARPKRHLASVLPVENVTFNAGCRLSRTRNSVGRMLHELGKRMHEENISAALTVN